MDTTVQSGLSMSRYGIGWRGQSVDMVFWHDSEGGDYMRRSHRPLSCLRPDFLLSDVILLVGRVVYLIMSPLLLEYARIVVLRKCDLFAGWSETCPLTRKCLLVISIIEMTSSSDSYASTCPIKTRVKEPSKWTLPDGPARPAIIKVRGGFWNYKPAPCGPQALAGRASPPVY